ncbi:RING/U-box superfamily protein [Artemisia annua]|uniref:RBR-type E3 ubiquitin transferase n=1 Tax=Artemisia annua TaxID=35608 RepID=A0A2U1M6S8_ARTAN|nr:RING/U-box superfamily protein [Artemisia annua]
MDNDYCSSSGEKQEDDFLSSKLESVMLKLLTTKMKIGYKPLPSSTLSVITKESLLAAEKKDLCRVMESLSLREHHSRTLLIHYHWDIQMLFTVLEEKGKARLLEEAGIPVLESQDSGLPLSSSMMACGICTQDIPARMMTKMDCGNCFCNNCWTEHFIVQINEGYSRRVRCMDHECSSICDEAIARNLVHERHPDLADKFDRFLVDSYIDEHKMVKWCPSHIRHVLVPCGPTGK